MIPSPGPEEFDELLACYVLDALDENERAMVEEYAARVPLARRRIEEFATAATFAVQAFGPPESAWERLAAAAFHPEGRRNDSARGQGPHRRPFTKWIFGGLVAAACLAGLTLGLVFVTGDGESSPAPLAVAANRARHQPGARSVALIARNGKVGASVVVLPSGVGYLTSHLAPLGAGRTYQLWDIDDSGGMISLGVLGGNPGVVAFSAVGGLKRFVITDERSPGVAVSHQPPTAIGVVPPADGRARSTLVHGTSRNPSSRPSTRMDMP